MNTPLLWFVNRGTGLVLLVLLTATTVMGVAATAARGNQWWPRSLTQGLHRSLALLSVSLLAAHVASAVLDSYVDIRWWQAIVPAGATYRPIGLALGAVALDVLVAVTLTSLLRHRMSQRPWRLVHALTWAAWALAVMHGLRTGTDVGTAWGRDLTLGCTLAVAGAVAVRLSLLARKAVRP